MPQVSLTPQQEATIAAANKELANAKVALDSATTEANSRLGDLNRCNCGKGKLIIKTSGYSAGTCVPLTSQVSFPNLADPSKCIDAPKINNCTTDCCEKSTCKNRAVAYNNSIAAYNGAKSNYDTAKNNLDIVLAAIDKDPAVHENANIINNEINAQKQKDMIKWLFFGLAALVIVGGAIYIGTRVLGTRSAA